MIVRYCRNFPVSLGESKCKSYDDDLIEMVRTVLCVNCITWGEL
jgi:hypothetical protein